MGVVASDLLWVVYHPLKVVVFDFIMRIVVNHQAICLELLEDTNLKPQITNLLVRGGVDGYRHGNASALETEGVEHVA